MFNNQGSNSKIHLAWFGAIGVTYFCGHEDVRGEATW